MKKVRAARLLARFRRGGSPLRRKEYPVINYSNSVSGSCVPSASFSIPFVQKRHFASEQHLFNVSEKLIEPADFVDRSKEAIEKINKIRSILRDDEFSYDLSYSSLLLLFDSISNELCNVIDVAELVRNIHSNITFQQSAESSFQLLSDLIIDLNSDVMMFDRLEEIVKHAKVIPRSFQGTKEAFLKNMKEKEEQNHYITEEEFNFANDLLIDYRLEGIHLIKQKVSGIDDINNKEGISNQQDLMKRIQSEIVFTESQFSHNIRQQSLPSFSSSTSSAPSHLLLGPFDLRNKPDYEDYEYYKKWISRQTSSDSQPSNTHPSFLQTPVNRRLLQPLLTSINNENIRRSIWFELTVQPISNLSTFSDLLKKRQQLSSLLSFPSFSHKSLSKHIYKKPEEIKTLLKHVSSKVSQQTKDEIQELLNIKSYLSSSANIKSIRDSTYLNPWDVSYLSHNYHAFYPDEEIETGVGNGKGSDANQQIRDYLSLESCLESLQFICQEIFNISFIEESISSFSEVWIDEAVFTGDGINLHDFGIRKYKILDNSSKKTLGFIYFDFYHRQGKFPGAAHFTIRCGCEKVRWNNSSKNINSNPVLKMIENSSIPETEKQLPVVVLVFNFENPALKKSSNQWSISNFLKKPNSFLSLSELETLYHECGHALHSLFSTTKFQHLSGTRGTTDFIEVSSFQFYFSLFLLFSLFSFFCV
jgi:intermediate peptidase